MFRIGLLLATIAGIVMIVARRRAARPEADLGGVSDNWIAEHRRLP